MLSRYKPVCGQTVLCVLLLYCCSAAAQSSTPKVSEPVLGLVFDEGAQTVRALMGIPAASRVDGTLDGVPLSATAISSEQAYALMLEDGTGAVMLVSKSGRRALPGVRSGAMQASVSARGTAAAIYFADTGKATLLSGLPDSPKAIGDVTLDGPPSMMTVSDDGTSLAAVVTLSDNDATLFIYTPSGAGQALLRDRRYSSLEFAPGGSSLLMATENAVYLYQARQGLQLVADQRDGVAKVVGAALSGDGKRVFIGMRSGLILIRDLVNSTQTFLTCSCEPEGMWRLRGKAVFRLNRLGAGPLWIVNGDPTEPRILFVAMPVGGQQ